VSTKAGTLYVVATPIGNLDDLGARAVSVLSAVDLIAAEDTRHSMTLLRRHGIDRPLRAYHEFNEREATTDLIEQLRGGASIALISDAGTPLISDPGYRLIAAAHDAGIPVAPVPGPSAVLAALSVCGLGVDRFGFEGYLPATDQQRRARLERLAAETRTLVFYEAPHRIEKALQDLVDIFGADRRAAIARELTKHYETVRRDTLGALLAWLQADPDQRKGEFVIVVEGAAAIAADAAELKRILGILLQHLSVKDAAAVAAELSGQSRRDLYAMALELRRPRDG
jgi:16S rRNA (cytidine1402-2'-O)-methyltransferase